MRIKDLRCRGKMGKYFNYYDFYNMKSDEQLTIISNFKTYLQTTKSTCGPACVLMMLNHYGDFSLSEMEIAKAVECKIPGGTKIQNIAEFLKSKGYDVQCSIYEKRDENEKIFSDFLDFRRFVLDNLKKNNPILVENVDLGGHYRLIIGYDQVNDENPRQDVIIFADPAENTSGNTEGYHYDSAYRFYQSWFDDHHLPREHKVQPYIVAMPIKK